ncbi:morphogenic membrane protein MmpA [Streptomyces sp. NPDC085927]
MTTCRASEPVAAVVRPTGRAMALGLVLAGLAGVGWIAGMIYTVLEWRF